MEQDIPGPFDTETRVHDVNLRGKSDTDWTIEWDDYIQKWNKQAETVVTRPLLEQPISYSHPYMRWYRQITRRCISKDSSQYDELADILVSHITTCPSETPGSGLHRGLEILNSLNRLAPATLDDASTSAPVNPPNDVDGTLHGSPFPGGRCRGAPRGRGASRGGGRARDEDGIRTAPPLTVGTDLEDHPAAPESTPATPIHPAAPESTPATSSHPMDINMSECVAPIEPSTEFGSIATPSVPIAHVEMTSTGPNQTCSHIKLSYLRRPFGKGITMASNNWILPRFADNYVREKYTDRREYYAGLRREWEYRYNESNTLYTDLVVLGAPLPDRVSLTMPRSNVVNYEKVVKQIRKENNLMLLRRCRYYMLQLAEEMATATQRELTPNERNNVLSYEEYLSDG
uniref:Aminotransferase-like plant mobile domain-containing protein n=2 Tax=Fagus sylvatica TaxID=28930 RepID=A0A2N9HYF3_FAGSY